MSATTIYWTDWKRQNASWRLYAGEQGLCRLTFPGETQEMFHPWFERHFPGYELVEQRKRLESTGILDRMSAYFRGEPVSFADIPMQLCGTTFQRAVWHELGRIPYAEVRTYRDIAEAIERPKAVRAVGAANGANPLPILLACHRVVGSDRTLTGYRGGLRIKRELLTMEGVRDIADKGHERYLF